LTLPLREQGTWALPGHEAVQNIGANTMTIELTGVVADYVAAVNAFDTDAVVATFARDAYINDNRREITGAESIRRFLAKEFIGDHLTMEVRDVRDHYGDIILRAKRPRG
jgi:ketosteroid isomerase-like protein